ncbi:hypothetical protein HY640_02245 [Candidatus Woesearchaeota archaeon]|nr:hypothetical protein [Candidatus Woesearchaeota archaeon]
MLKKIDLRELAKFRLGNPYGATLQEFDLTEAQYFIAAKRFVSDWIWAEKLHERDMELLLVELLEEYRYPDWAESHDRTPIHSIEALLFMMEPDYIRNVFHQQRKRERKKLPDGMLKNPYNIEELVAAGIESEMTAIAHATREEAVRLITAHAAKKGVQLYLRSIFSLQIADSPITLFRVLDSYLMRTRGWESLFDLEQTEHLHFWDFKVQGSLQDPAALQQRISHTLEDNINGLREASREDAVRLLTEHVVKSPTGARAYLMAIGMEPALAEGLRRTVSTALDALKLYDQYLQRKKRQASLFDLTQQTHLHPWGMYMKGQYSSEKNVREMVAHLLEEAIPCLRQATRDEAVYELVSAFTSRTPRGTRQICRMGLNSVARYGLNGAMRESPLGVLQTYDAIRMQQDAVWKSIFDSTQPIYIAVETSSGGNPSMKLIRGIS